MNCSGAQTQRGSRIPKMAQNVKTFGALAIASVKTVEGLAIASAKTIMGVDNTSSGFNPSTYGTPIGWWKGDDATVSNWPDDSGNNRDFDQANPTFQPSITAGALDGHAGVTFASGDVMVSATITDNIGTVFVVVGNITYSTANAIFGAPVSSKRLVTWFPNATTIYDGDGSEFFGSSTPTWVNGVSTYAFPGSSGYGLVTQSSTPVSYNDVLFLGESGVNDDFVGTILEILIYEEQLSGGNRAAVEAYFLAKYPTL